MMILEGISAQRSIVPNQPRMITKDKWKKDVKASLKVGGG